MAGRTPKPPGQKRNRVKPPVPPQRLGSSVPGRVPPLPGAGLMLESTVEWWETVWRSPMAAVFLPADVPALVRLAGYVELVSLGEASASIHAEIRQLEDRFGLSPLARRRLQWEIDMASADRAASDPEQGAEDEGRWLRAVQN